MQLHRPNHSSADGRWASIQPRHEQRKWFAMLTQLLVESTHSRTRVNCWHDRKQTITKNSEVLPILWDQAAPHSWYALHVFGRYWASEFAQPDEVTCLPTCQARGCGGSSWVLSAERKFTIAVQHTDTGGWWIIAGVTNQ